MLDIIISVVIAAAIIGTVTGAVSGIRKGCGNSRANACDVLLLYFIPSTIMGMSVGTAVGVLGFCMLIGIKFARAMF